MSKRRVPPKAGRAVIEDLKAEYRNRVELGSADVWRIARARVKGVSQALALRWDRQARVEMAITERIAITHPVRRNGYQRVGKPTAVERKRSFRTRQRDTFTRVTNDTHHAQAVATNGENVQPHEMVRVLMYEAMEKFVEAIKLNDQL